MDGLYVGVLPPYVYAHDAFNRWVATHEELWGKRWIVYNFDWINEMQFWERGRAEVFIVEAFRWHQHEMLGERPLLEATHLMDIDARISIRMEATSLANAMDARDEAFRLEHITNALSFRANRRRTFGNAEYENNAELWDGLQNYMQWTFMQNRDERWREYGFGRYADIVREDNLHSRFGWSLGALYAFLLDEFGFPWHTNINAESDMGQILADALGITPHGDASRINEGSHFAAMVEREERVWLERAMILLDDFDERMENHTVIKFFNEDVQGFLGGITNGVRGHIRVSFSSVPGFSVISGYFEWSGYFGTIYIQDDILFSHNDGFTFVSAESIQINGNTITADTWTLELNEGYELMAYGDNFRVVPRI
jgi:hypothetical protein